VAAARAEKAMVVARAVAKAVGERAVATAEATVVVERHRPPAEGKHVGISAGGPSGVAVMVVVW